jgi:multiple sugar transport system permease protein
MSTPTLQPEVRAEVTRVEGPRRSAPRRRRRRRRRNRLPYALIAPALVFMVLVHVLPAAGGIVLSFKKFNLFTFHQLFGAPWNGLENYRSILLESDNPLHTGFWGAVSNTAVYTFCTVAGTLVGGLAIALCCIARCAASASCGR